MSVPIITVSFLVILTIITFIVVPILRYKLSIKDALRFCINERYQLFVYAHDRFSKVREGKQVYERYCIELKSLYNKDNFNKLNSEHDNNSRRIDLNFLAEVVDDEQFVRRFFSGESLPYDKFVKMNTEWEMRPIDSNVTDSLDDMTDKQSEGEVISDKPKTTRIKTDAFFRDLLLDGAPQNTEDYVSKYVRVKMKAGDLVNLYYALQEAEFINCDWKTFYNAVRNSYPEYINREERTFRGAKAKRDRTTVSSEIWENHQIEHRIIKQIQERLNP